jgi:hypothetical protein
MALATGLAEAIHPDGAACLCMGPVRCTLIRMATPSSIFKLRRFSEVDRRQACWNVLPILLAVLAAMSSAASASARSANGFQTATLVETAKYIPCALGCSLAASPASAFCLRVGSEVLVGEGRSYLHENKFTGMEDWTGKQVSLRFNRRTLWIKPPDRSTVKIRRGSLFEGFKDAGCAREVHTPILAKASRTKRPAGIPPDAFALAGSGKGDYQPQFLWFQCAMDSGAATISCRRWVKNGGSYGTEWYCAQTVDGAPVAADFDFDPLLSRSERLVLKSGAVLQRDNRARTNDQLDRPTEACR